MRLCHSETNDFGITRRYFSDPMTGAITVEEAQDVESIVENNKRLASGNGRAISSDVANPVASIPTGIILKWLREEGWWVYDAHKDPDVERKLNQKLNSNEWRYLRTSELIL